MSKGKSKPKKMPMPAGKKSSGGGFAKMKKMSHPFKKGGMC